MNREDIISAIEEALEGRRHVSEKEHHDHHEFIKVMIEKERRRQERWDRIKTQTIGWSITSIMTALGAAVVFWVKNNGGTH